MIFSPLIDSLGEDSNEKIVQIESNKKLSIRNSIRKNNLHMKPRNRRSSESNNTERRRCSYPTNSDPYQKNIPKRHSAVSSSSGENNDRDGDFVPLETAFERYPHLNDQVLFGKQKEPEICNGIANMQSESKHENGQKQCSLPTRCVNDVLTKDCNADNINAISGKDKNCRHKQTIYIFLHLCIYVYKIFNFRDVDHRQVCRPSISVPLSTPEEMVFSKSRKQSFIRSWASRKYTKISKDASNNNNNNGTIELGHGVVESMDANEESNPHNNNNNNNNENNEATRGTNESTDRLVNILIKVLKNYDFYIDHVFV